MALERVYYPRWVERAQAQMRLEFQLSSRWEIKAGNFFVSVPESADAYLLKWILHDWDDTPSIGILGSCRKAMKPTSNLLVIEHVVGSPNASPEGKFLDLSMTVMNGGRKPTHEEFASLLEEAGFRLTSTTPTACAVSILEIDARSGG